MKHLLLLILLLTLLSCSEDSISPVIDEIEIKITSSVNGQINTPVKFKVTWENNTSYQYNDQNFKVYYGKDSTAMTFASQLRTNYYTFEGLEKGKRYFWKVELYDKETLLGTSKIFWFETAASNSFTYLVKPPAGFLPYPNHDPTFNAAKYAQIEKDISIINNYGLYQANVEGTFTYFHDGLDFVLPNDTKLFSLANGVVISRTELSEYYYVLLIEDLENPGYAWQYVHIDEIQHQVGDTVKAGEFICEINFRGLDHLHLNRVKKAENKQWIDSYFYDYEDPFKYFKFTDTEAPTIDDTFYYHKNNSDDNALDADSTISGEVDIIVGMRDGGEYAHLKGENTLGSPSIEGFGDRLAVAKIEYSIYFNDNLVEQKESVNFLEFKINRSIHKPEMFFKHWTLFDDKPRSGNKVLSYYLITINCNNDIKNSSEANSCWDTTEKKQDGTSKYPNGIYTIKVKAYDSMGNVSEKSSTVEVKN